MEDNTKINVLKNVQMVRLFRHNNNYNHQDDFFNRITQHCKTIRFQVIVSYANSHWCERTVFFSQSSKWKTKNTKLAGKCSHLLHLLWLTTCSKTSSFQIRKSMSNNLKENWISGLTQGQFSLLFLIPLFIY